MNTQDIRDWIGPQSFQRAQRYFRDGAVLETLRRGTTLKARCEGSQPEPYQVEATLSAKGIANAHCSCPVGEGGRCKHVAAALLAWAHNPEDFVELEDIESALERRSKGELIALIKQMLRTLLGKEKGGREMTSHASVQKGVGTAATAEVILPDKKTIVDPTVRLTTLRELVKPLQRRQNAGRRSRRKGS